MSGSVSILDAERKDFRATVVGGDIFCGDWVSTEKGKAIIEFPRKGRVIVGSHTFFQILDPAAGSNIDHDHFVLYRGDIYYEGLKKGETTKLITPNTRVTLSNGKGVVSFLEETHATQVISVEGSLQFENRFLKHTPFRVDRGFISTMAQGHERVLPGRQTTAESKSLDQKLEDLEIPSSDRKSIVDYVLALAKRKLVVKLGDHSKRGIFSTTEGGRSPASVPEKYSAVESEKHREANTASAPAVHAANGPVMKTKNRTPKRKRRSLAYGNSSTEVDRENVLNFSHEKKRLLESLSAVTEEEI